MDRMGLRLQQQPTCFKLGGRGCPSSRSMEVKQQLGHHEHICEWFGGWDVEVGTPSRNGNIWPPNIHAQDARSEDTR